MVTLIGVVAHGGDHMGAWGVGWMWLWGMAMMVLFVAWIVWGVRAANVPTSAQRTSRRSPTDRACEILAERYARGELTTEEYRERVSELE